MTGELLPTIRFHILKWEMHNQMCVPAHLGTKVSQKPKTRSSGAMLVIYLKLRCEIGELLTAISSGKGVIKCVRAYLSLNLNHKQSPKLVSILVIILVTKF